MVMVVVVLLRGRNSIAGAGAARPVAASPLRALGLALARVIEHRSHEHRALHDVSRAWHAAWPAAEHAVLVADDVVLGRGGPPSFIDVAELSALAALVPTN